MYVFVPPLLRLCYRYYNVVVLDASLVVEHLSYQSWYDSTGGYVCIRKMIHKFFFLFSLYCLCARVCPSYQHAEVLYEYGLIYYGIIYGRIYGMYK